MATTIEINTTTSAGEDHSKREQHLSNEKIHAIFEAASALTFLSGGPSGTDLATNTDSSEETERIPPEVITAPSHINASNKAQIRKPRTSVIETTKSVQSHYIKKTVRHLPDHKKPNAALTFPEKLMNMMDFAEGKLKNGDTHYCVAWQPDGLSFIIRHPQDFTRDVLSLFFKQTKFSSFTRKLYRWGFRQVNRGAPGASANPNEPVVFGNDFFQRDNKSLISKMRSVTAASTKRSVIPKDPPAHVLPREVLEEPLQQQIEITATMTRKRKANPLEESILPAAPRVETSEGANADDKLNKRRFLQMALECADSYNETTGETSTTTHSGLAGSISALRSQTSLRMNPTFKTSEQILASSLVANPGFSSSFPLSAISGQFGAAANGNTNTLANSLLLKSRMDILSAQSPMFSLRSALTAGLGGRNGCLFIPPPPARTVPPQPTTPPIVSSAPGGGGQQEFPLNPVSGADIVNEAIDALKFAS